MTVFQPDRNAPLRAVFFDLDGTLVDSAPDIAVATNKLMTAHGLEPHSLQAVRDMIGDGMAVLVQRAFSARGVALTQADFRDRYEKMVDFYAQTLTQHTTLRSGAFEAVASARKAGLRTGVVTNKPEGFSRIILAHFKLLSQFEFVLGGDSGHTRKPAPDMLLAACSLSQCAPQEALMIGDGPVDAAAAKAASIPCILVRGGYCTVAIDTLGASRIINELDDLCPLFATAGEVA